MRKAAILCLAAGASLGAIAQAEAQAQDTPGVLAPAQTDDGEQVIVVTGTNIRGAQIIGSEVLAIGAEDIAASGRATAADFLRELPSNFAGGVGQADNSQGSQDASVAGSNLTGGQGVNLRGLGSLSTLVLVNGRRVAASGQLGDFVDISTIPTIAIDRVEVLQDGASAIYGSDAVGGVVNFILKDRADGLDLSARIGTTTQGGGTEAQLGTAYGTDWGSGSLFAAYEYYHRGAIAADQRDLYNRGDYSDRGGVNWPLYAGHAGSAANLFQGAAAGNGRVIARVPGGAGTGLTSASLIPVTDGIGNTYDPWAALDIMPQVDRHSIYATVRQDLSPTVALFAEARHAWRDTDYDGGYTALYGTLPATSPFFIPGAGNSFGVLIDDAPLIRQASVRSLAARAGLDVALGARWNATVQGSYSREKQRRYSTSLRNSNIYDYVTQGGRQVQGPSANVCALTGISAPRPGLTPAQALCAGLGYAPFNPYTTDPLSQTVLDQLIGFEDLAYTSQLVQGSVTLDGTLFTLPAGEVKLALGGDWRREWIDGDLRFNVRSTADETARYGRTTREVAAAFAELAIPLVAPDAGIPLVRSLDLSGAVRYEHGSGLGGFDTTNPRFGADWSPVEGLTLRGSWGTSFHAPPMRYAYDGVQPTTGGNGAFMRADLYTAPCNTNLVPLNGVIGTPGGAGTCTFTAIVVAGGAGPTLAPETAETWTLGADFNHPDLPGLRLGLSYFNICIDDRIVRISGGQLGGILASYFAFGSSPYGALLDFRPDLAAVTALQADPRYLGQLGTGAVQAPEDVAAIVNATQTNLAALRMDGIDLSASLLTDLGKAGELRLFFNGTRLFSYDVQPVPGAPWDDELGKYNAVGNPVEFRSRQGLGWTLGAFSATGTVNYVAPYECDTGCYVPGPAGTPVLATRPVPIDSWVTVDLALGYRLSGVRPALRDAAVMLNVVNMLDQDPPFIDGGTAANDTLADPYDAANATVLGRTVALTLTAGF